MAHEGLSAFLAILGALLIMSFYLGPGKEVRKVKRLEGKIMLLPTGVILLTIAVIVFSGILNNAP